MGEAKRRQAEMVRRGERCIYCASPATTVEHMPPTFMFLGADRPKGMEYGACRSCNEGTKAADLVAGLIARIERGRDVNDPAFKEMVHHRGMVEKRAPGLLDEIFTEKRTRWIRQPNGLLEQFTELTGDGPLLKAYLDVFSAKFGMALFKEHTGQPFQLADWLILYGT